MCIHPNKPGVRRTYTSLHCKLFSLQMKVVPLIISIRHQNSRHQRIQERNTNNMMKEARSRRGRISVTTSERGMCSGEYVSQPHDFTRIITMAELHCDGKQQAALLGE